MNLKHLSEWQTLTLHQAEIAGQHMRDWFAKDGDRGDKFSIESDYICLDYSRNLIQEKTLLYLEALVKKLQLDQKIAALFDGECVNLTENRPALHTALRDRSDQACLVHGENIMPRIYEMRQQMRTITRKIHEKKWLGATGKPIQSIINIGIGGSHLGPMMASKALQDFAISDLKFYFIATVDKVSLEDVLSQIDPETSLFIISSKTFTTIETLTNARTVVSWMQQKLHGDVLQHHFIGITSAIDKAKAFGISSAHILPLWDWVGGRYSIWSAIGLPLMLQLGIQQFENFLAGAYQMDKHFKEQPFSQNIPQVLALIGIWYANFFGASAKAIIPYSHRLRYLIAYLQQAEMESNGKSITCHGSLVDYATGPIIFGEEGCNGQHAYHQLLLQGNHLIPVDFILVGQSNSLDVDLHQDVLLASGLSQAQALMKGKTYQEAFAELSGLNHSQDEAESLAKHRMIPGNRPSNILYLERLTPKHLGALIALYEHKIFVQGAIWQINSFDQWGVELGKQLLPNILDVLQDSETNYANVDAALIPLIKRLKRIPS